jgi:hypothetical protein
LERTGHPALAANVWYFGIICCAPLLLLALHEASGLWHRRILFAWMALMTAAAWIRYFPYTGRAVLLIDAAAFIAWMAEKYLAGRVLNWRRVRGSWFRRR